MLTNKWKWKLCFHLHTLMVLYSYKQNKNAVILVHGNVLFVNKENNNNFVDTRYTTMLFCLPRDNVCCFARKHFTNSNFLTLSNFRVTLFCEKEKTLFFVQNCLLLVLPKLSWKTVTWKLQDIKSPQLQATRNCCFLYGSKNVVFSL